MALKKFLKDVEKLRKEHKQTHIPSPKRHDAHDESNWLVSYADMMTLLCGFFIMLFSLSKLDEPKYEVIKEAIAKQFGGKYTPPNNELTQMVNQVIEETGLQKNANIKTDPYGVTVELESTFFFDSLSAELKLEGKVALNKMVETLAREQIKKLSEYPIVIEGHTDGRPIVSGIYPSNWELSAARATRVARLFIDHGFAPKKIVPIGFADTRPNVPERNPAGLIDEAALSKNRRVIIRIFNPNVQPLNYDTASTAH